jgi:hypothetical protein
MQRALDRIAPIVASTAEAISRRLGYAPRWSSSDAHSAL